MNHILESTHFSICSQPANGTKLSFASVKKNNLKARYSEKCLKFGSQRNFELKCILIFQARLRSQPLLMLPMLKMFAVKSLPLDPDTPSFNTLAREHTEWWCKYIFTA